MIHILPHYSIDSNTMALLPAKHTEYETIILDTHKKAYVKQTPLELIKESCLSRFTTYEGIKEAVYQLTGYKRKVPIPINPYLNMYFFPTHATNHNNCSWISYYHVLRIIKNHKTQTNKSSSTILFKNGQTLNLNVSTYILKQQMKRTLECKKKYFYFHEDNRALREILKSPIPLF